MLSAIATNRKIQLLFSMSTKRQSFVMEQWKIMNERTRARKRKKEISERKKEESNRDKSQRGIKRAVVVMMIKTAMGEKVVLQ